MNLFIKMIYILFSQLGVSRCIWRIYVAAKS
jgi:hypothetical protein